MTNSIKVNKTYSCPNRQNTHASPLFDRMTLVCGPMGGVDVNRTANPSNFYFLFCAALKTHAPELNKHRNFIKIIFLKNQILYWTCSNSDPFSRVPMKRVPKMLATGCCPSSDRRWMDRSVLVVSVSISSEISTFSFKFFWSCACKWKVKIFGNHFQTGGSPFRFQRTCPLRCTCSHSFEFIF